MASCTVQPGKRIPHPAMHMDRSAPVHGQRDELGTNSLLNLCAIRSSYVAAVPMREVSALGQRRAVSNTNVLEKNTNVLEKNTCLVKNNSCICLY